MDSYRRWRGHARFYACAASSTAFADHRSPALVERQRRFAHRTHPSTDSARDIAKGDATLGVDLHRRQLQPQPARLRRFERVGRAGSGTRYVRAHDARRNLRVKHRCAGRQPCVRRQKGDRAHRARRRALPAPRTGSDQAGLRKRSWRPNVGHRRQPLPHDTGRALHGARESAREERPPVSRI
jgi:hypothetical protein